MDFNKIIELANSWQSETALIFGMVLQFFLSPVKNVKIFTAILLSSFFVAIYVIDPFIDVMRIETGTNMEKSLYAISSLLSMEILSLIINIVPKGVSMFLRKKLGLKDVSDN